MEKKVKNKIIRIKWIVRKNNLAAVFQTIKTNKLINKFQQTKTNIKERNKIIQIKILREKNCGKYENK